jgi:hypothetical protein
MPANLLMIVLDFPLPGLPNHPGQILFYITSTPPESTGIRDRAVHI